MDKIISFIASALMTLFQAIHHAMHLEITFRAFPFTATSCESFMACLKQWSIRNQMQTVELLSAS
jgi:hypothetical protein